MTKFVVDASVAIRWVLPEIHTAAALRLRHPDYELFVPDFFFPELGNVFWKRIRRGEVSLEDAQVDLQALGDLVGKFFKYLRPVGFEPTAYRLEGGCSIR